MVRRDSAGLEMAGSGRRGTVRSGMSRRDMAGFGVAGVAWVGAVRLGPAGCSSAGMARLGAVRPGASGLDSARPAWLGEARFGTVWHARVWRIDYFSEVLRMARRRTNPGATETIPLADIVEDFDIYPRHSVCSTHVQSLLQAIRQYEESHGEKDPPFQWRDHPIADRKTKRIVDGMHRKRAWGLAYGPDACLEIAYRDYASERELIEDAISRNASHGLKLQECDIGRAAKMLEHLGASQERIGIILHISQKRVQTITARFVLSETRTKMTVPGTFHIPAKPAVRHLETLNAAQATAHDSMPGVPLTLLAKQLRLAIQTELIDRDNERLMTELRLLHVALAGVFVEGT